MNLTEQANAAERQALELQNSMSSLSQVGDLYRKGILKPMSKPSEAPKPAAPQAPAELKPKKKKQTKSSEETQGASSEVENGPGPAAVLCGVQSISEIVPEWAGMSDTKKRHLRGALNKQARKEHIVPRDGPLRQYLESKGQWPHPTFGEGKASWADEAEEAAE